MKSLFKKIRGNKKGFTLAELLVVVAIVGILVAISIPVFTSQLAKARKATNQANMRAAKAAAVAQYLTDNEDGKEAVYYDYDLEKGIATKGTADSSLTATAIEDATSDKRYTAIQVSVKAAEISTDGNTGNTTVKSDGNVVIYVK
ncbi:prepilin-type N-terminal cleavage/methylation domain-containing protein [Clostridium sp. OF09-36]|uniref:type IV pilin protein n=1 Tax=Clostridium sp. OF09-36 TaxID=2292310 RepID=UPI000E4A1C0C|nr:prepilin-type N-terminal cleavage/methylation domain-containing protein [Clostridium sp. OF09-36]RHV85620.1 prepilin-type N-terminal cleavage/methylation domain-containing protein [Clostridium sp. OF09-36]